MAGQNVTGHPDTDGSFKEPVLSVRFVRSYTSRDIPRTLSGLSGLSGYRLSFFPLEFHRGRV
jgi:hypothetical protein